MEENLTCTNNYRLCPVLQIAVSIRMTAGGVPAEDAVYCDGSACAWYDAARECCAVLEAAKSLRALGK